MNERCGCTCGLPGCSSRRGINYTHGRSGYHRGCRCEVCTAEETAHGVRRHARQQVESLGTATRYRQQWTGPELETIMRPDLSAAECARMLGRSIYSVYRMRMQCRSDPRYAKMAGVEVAS